MMNLRRERTTPWQLLNAIATFVQWIRPLASRLIRLLIGGFMTTAITVPHVQRKLELLGDGIHNEQPYQNWSRQ
jgi:hypothetical protein